MEAYRIFLTSPLEKVFPVEKPKERPWKFKKVLQGEKIQLQLVLHGTKDKTKGTKAPVKVTLTGPSSFLREVKLLPSQLPTWPDYDEDYLKTEPGLFPDLLQPSKGEINIINGQYRSLWLEIDTKDLKPGAHTEKIIVTSGDSSEVLYEEKIKFEVLEKALKKATFNHTEWFHVDGICHFYHLTPYEEKCWDYLDNFARFAVEKSHINTLLTPVFTPPLDTEVGKERMNVQLLKITHQNNEFQFDFTNVRRWLKMCKRVGIENIEIPHLFTQWGAKATPNIYLEDGTKIFGWHIPATSSLYRTFLENMIPALITVLNEEGYDKEHIIFHISDEPSLDNLEEFKKVVAQVEDLLEGYQIMDALGDLDFFEGSNLTFPVVANDAIEPFLEKKVPSLWTYYCCAQTNDVPNRFFSLPSYRNRVMGALMYAHNIQGFLHWGFNFYNSVLSKRPINPYEVTDADCSYPSGDPFLVYPGENGEVLSSIRNEVQMAGFQDLALLQQAEKAVGKKKVMKKVLEITGEPFDFTHFPKNDDWFDTLHDALVTMIQKK